MSSSGKKPHGVQEFDGSNWEDLNVEFRRYTRYEDSVKETRVWDVITGAWERPLEPAADVAEEERDIEAAADMGQGGHHRNPVDILHHLNCSSIHHQAV